MHDLFPDVLVMSGFLKPASIVTRAIRAANAMMFRGLDTVITIGRDSERLLLRYKGLPPDKLRFIPNWATLAPGIRPIEPSNPFRRAMPARFMVGLSGNLGFTHDPLIVFEAARLLRDEAADPFPAVGLGARLRDVEAVAGRGEAAERHAGRTCGRR